MISEIKCVKELHQHSQWLSGSSINTKRIVIFSCSPRTNLYTQFTSKRRSWELL